MPTESENHINFLHHYCQSDHEDIFGIYQSYKNSIGLLRVDRREYELKVPNEDRPGFFYHVTLNAWGSILNYECSCDKKNIDETCIHVALASIFILSKTAKMTLNEIKGAIHSNPKDIIEQKPTMNEHRRPQPILQETKKGDEWKTFNSSPRYVFSTIYSFDYGFVTRANLLLTSIKEILEDAIVEIRFVFRKDKTTDFHPKIRYDRGSLFSYCCDCNETKKICTHARTAFELIQEKKGRAFFLDLKDLQPEKNQLLQGYGLTTNDAEAKEFSFYLDGNDNLKITPPSWLWKENINDKVTGLRKIFDDTAAINVSRPQLGLAGVVDFEIGFMLNFCSSHFKLGFDLEVIKVYQKSNKETYKKLNFHQPENLGLLQSLPNELYDSLVKISDKEVVTFLKDRGFSSMFYYANPWNSLPESCGIVLRKYFIEQIIALWPLLCNHEKVYMLTSGSFSSANIKPVKPSLHSAKFRFVVSLDSRFIKIAMLLSVNGEDISKEDAEIYENLFWVRNGFVHIFSDVTDNDLLRQFKHGFIKIPVSGLEQVIKSVIPLLELKYPVEVPDTLSVEKITPEIKCQVLVHELDNKFLVLQPQYDYEGLVLKYTPNPENIFQLQPDGRYKMIVRDRAKEQHFFDSLRSLHPKFMKPPGNQFYFLEFEDTMKNNWFLETVRLLMDNDITVLGMQELKRHRYNTNKPTFEIKAGSGIDWFDLQIEVSFGDQMVTLRDIKKAVMGKQNIVVLGDGTFGVLPEAWLKQYGMLLKMGDEQKDGSLRVSKLHFTLIDELYSQIDDEKITREIEEKKQRLRNIANVKTVKPHKDIKATLRPYQLSGFQWFQTLDELGWGGCLADDMGLGKTLQAITFLQYLKHKYKGATHLVICPTSLIYNWESELKKFAPALKYHIYYGLVRELTETHFNDFDIVITSYGIIRNDLEQFRQFKWHYIFLDESQAIKNPEAQTNKALQLLQSKNRMILSGTPIQNNTFDLFAQFHFINPGLLGNKEFFKTEFANPIDKNNDTEKSAQLRRLIFPFMLRRTKEQVATDLPAKTETVLWCEMGREQKAVYNDYKNYYRNTLLEKIEEVGIAKAGMYVLEGLLRLRQICDSPVLVKDTEVTTKESAKINELMREIEENSGGHKLLVFSQFTEMMHLIEDQLTAEKVKYVYLDGSTPAEKRKEAVEIFQSQPDVRVFLISLKAGGVGLNLTAADYVYIVDPWWNPAVEQQAIDRTHRIGQTNPIFAYKMICKDTVEEKIVQLQQRKKQLANDLVTEDAGFIKKLTKDDIAFLFS